MKFLIESSQFSISLRFLFSHFWKLGRFFFWILGKNPQPRGDMVRLIFREKFSLITITHSNLLMLLCSNF